MDNPKHKIYLFMMVKVKNKVCTLTLTKFEILPYPKLFCKKKNPTLFQNYKDSLAMANMV
jgi:hypothetical protein